MKSHYSDDELEKGYAIISDSKGHGASRIKAIPELGRCFYDKEAMICAKQDGIRIIEDVVFVKHHRAFYIDTPENRMILAPLVQTASDVKFVENKDEKHKDNAKYGWYWCTTHFSLPITDDKHNITGKNFFRGRMVIRHSKSGKNYLYDIVDIKKET